MTELNIRDARPDDRAAIEDVTICAYQQYAPTMLERWDIYRHGILGTLGDVRPAGQIAAENDGALVGTVLLFPAGTAFKTPSAADASLAGPEIRLLAVAPAARGQGVGAALMNECMRRARQAGVPAITLHTTDMMQVAMSIYEHMGFVRAGVGFFAGAGICNQALPLHI